VTSLTDTDLAAGGARQAPPVPLKPVRLGVAGLGRAGIVHAAVARSIPNVELVGFAESSGTLRTAARGAGFRLPSFDRLAIMRHWYESGQFNLYATTKSLGFDIVEHVRRLAMMAPPPTWHMRIEDVSVGGDFATDF
jgi:hypothetical protein